MGLVVGSKEMVQGRRRSLLIVLLLALGCSRQSVLPSAADPSVTDEQTVQALNDSGAEVLLGASGEAVAVKLPADAHPDLVNVLAKLSGLKRVDASDTKLSDSDFAGLKSKWPELFVTLPR